MFLAKHKKSIKITFLFLACPSSFCHTKFLIYEKHIIFMGGTKPLKSVWNGNKSLKSVRGDTKAYSIPPCRTSCKKSRILSYFISKIDPKMWSYWLFFKLYNKIVCLFCCEISTTCIEFYVLPTYNGKITLEG